MSRRNKTSKLFVANISSKVSRSELEDRFDRYGKVLDVKVREGRDRDRIAFIEFDDARDAEYAYDKLQGYELCGRELRIEFSNGGRRERNNDKKDSAPCFVCNRKGHWASDCPKGAQQGIKKGTCFVCGEDGHKMRDCPKNRNWPPRSRSRGSSGSKSRSRSRSRSKSERRNHGRNRSYERPRNDRRSRSKEHQRRGPSSSRSRSSKRSTSHSEKREGDRERERPRSIQRSRS